MNTPILDEMKVYIDCPKYPFCGADVCPLTSDWKKTFHNKSSEVCLLFLEVQKPTATTFFKTWFANSGALIQELKLVIPIAINRHPILRLQLGVDND